MHKLVNKDIETIISLVKIIGVEAGKKSFSITT